MPYKSGQTTVNVGTINVPNADDLVQSYQSWPQIFNFNQYAVPFSLSIPQYSKYKKVQVVFDPVGEFGGNYSVDRSLFIFAVYPDVKEYATWQQVRVDLGDGKYTYEWQWVVNTAVAGKTGGRQGIAYLGGYGEFTGAVKLGNRATHTVTLEVSDREQRLPPEQYKLYASSAHHDGGRYDDADVYPRVGTLRNVKIIVDYAEEYLAPTKPTSIGLSAKTSYGQAVTLSWSGATQPRRLNPITGYQVQYSDNGGTWKDLKTVSSTAGYASTTVQPELSTTGTVRRFRIRTIATESDAKYSDWAECPDTLTKLDDTPQMDSNRIRLSKNWSLGDEVILSWSNVTVYWPEENPVIRYEVQYIDSTGTEWLTYGSVPTNANTGQIFVSPPDVEGDYRRFRIRPVGKRAAAQYGVWVECRVTLSRRGEFVSGESGEIHLPRLLDRNLREICTLYPIKCTVNLKINPLSTANMTILQKDAPDEILVRQFVEVYTKQGSAGIYQISQITHDYSSGTVKLDLQHGLTTLSDSLLPEVGRVKGSVEEVFAALLNYQTSVQPSSNTAYWRFGAYYGTGDYEINYEWSSTNLLEGLCEMMEQMGDRAYLDFDQSETPWKLNVMEFPPDISECRLSRNLTSISVDVDSSLLCTRIYPYGAGEGSERVTIGNPAYIDADTKNIYGIIARAEVVDNITDAAVLRTVAEKFLSQHKHPAVSISLGAIDLSDATGEEVDGFHIGWTCRVPLPAYGQTYTEHITGIKWSDVYNAPGEMQLTLANESVNVADSLADLLSAYETSALANKSLR